MVISKSNQNSKNKCKYFNRGNRCYGIPLSSLCIMFVRGIRSWTESKLWKFLNDNFNDIIDSFISVKYTNTFGDTFFRIKVNLTLEQTKKVCADLETLLPFVNASCNKVNHYINKKSFRDIKKGILCMKTTTHSNLSHSNSINTSTSSASNLSVNNLIQPNHSQSSSTNNVEDLSSSSNNPPENDSLEQNLSFCLSWNTNGWNFKKRDSIEYFNYVFKPLFLCFQETGNGSKLGDDIFCKVTVRNYRYFKKRADNSLRGIRGLYLGYHHSCQASLENNEFNYILSLSTFSLWNHSECSIGNIYVPQRRYGLERRVAKTEIASWLRSHSDHASILIGDFNCSTENLQKFISSFPGWTIYPISGSDVSWTRGEFYSDIDHAIVNFQMLEKLSSATFVDYPPISDHRPLLIYSNDLFLNDSFSLPKKYVRWDRNQCKIVQDSISNNNKFSILNNEIFHNTNLTTDEIVEKFLSISKDIANEYNIINSIPAHKNLFNISKAIFYLQKKKVFLYKNIRNYGSLQNLDGFLDVVKFYKRVCKSIHKKSNEFRKKEYQHWIEVGCKHAIQHNGKKMWNWIKRTAKSNKNSNSCNQPIKDKNGQLVTSTESQLKVFHNHYKKLASDPNNKSLSKDYWRKNQFICNSIPVRSHRDWDINQEISREEIKEAILSIPNYKASGPDGIPIEFFKAMLPGSNSDSSSNSGLDFLHLLFNRIWDGDFPEAWNKASIVSIPKKGDLTDCDNYRGISLINNGIKIISKIVATRISNYGIRHNFIRPEQFGFRNKEECISLYISIREICQRRKINGKSTYLAFLDLKKAYDSVPIYNILTKLFRLGIRGKSYKFLENLYLSSKACVKKDNQYSETFNIMRGVRQGCPLSPILFNLFINDVFNDCEKFGVKVGTIPCCGGLFADDIVLCAPEKKYLDKLLDRVNHWAINNHMTFGINKCATMVVRPDSFKGGRDPTHYLGNKKIPIVKCYTYLGIPFDNTLSLKPVIDSMKNKVRKALYNSRGFLRNPLIPIPFKRTIISSIVISRVAYYAPLLGSNKINTSGTQSLINKGLYWISRLSEKNSFVSLYALTKELNIPPLSAKCALSQIRCFKKWKNSNCIISTLVNNIPKHRQYFWSKKSQSLINRMNKRKLESEKAIKEYYWNRDICSDGIKAKRYKKNKFEVTREYYKLGLKYPQYTRGFHWLLKARCGYRIDSEVLKAAKLVKSSYPDQCTCCNSDNSKQTLEHWLMQCSTFNELRSKILDFLDIVLSYFNTDVQSINNENSGSNSGNNGENNGENNSNDIVNNSNSNIVIGDINLVNLNGNNNGNNNENNNGNYNDVNIGVVNSNSNRGNSSVNANSSVNNLSVNRSGNTRSTSKCSKVFNFLLGGRRKNKRNNNNTEWEILCKHQIKSGDLSEVPFLAKTAAFFNTIMPIVSGQQWLVFNKHTTKVTKSANAEKTVRQARSARVRINRYAHATERNRNSSSGSQT